MRSQKFLKEPVHERTRTVQPVLQGQGWRAREVRSGAGQTVF